MCSFCGSLGGNGHWSDKGPDEPGLRRSLSLTSRLIEQVLSLRGVQVLPFEGDAYLVKGKLPSPERADHLVALWPVAERIGAAACDPLDPTLLAELEKIEGGREQ